MAPPEGVLVIKNENEAWEAIRQLLEGELQFKNLDGFDLKNWPKIKITVQQGESIITPSMMEGFLELQKAILRSHALLRYGAGDLRRLPDDDKDALQFEVKVTEGSSNYEIDLQALLEKIGLGLIDKMEPWHIVAVVIAMGVLYAGGSYLKTVLQHKLEKRRMEIQAQEKKDQLEHLQFTAQQETERQKLLADLVKRVPEVRAIESHAENAKNALLESVSTVPSAKIDGVAIDGETAAELMKSARRHSEEIRTSATYRVLRVDTTSPEGFRVRLQNIRTAQELTAIVPDAVRYEKQCDDIQEAEWSKGRVKVTIEGIRRGDDISDAKIVATEPIKKD
jgi:hypothetical protein